MPVYLTDDDIITARGLGLNLSVTYGKKHWGAKIYNIKSQCLSGWLWFYIDDVVQAKYKIRNPKHREAYMNRAVEEFANIKGKKYFVWKPNFINTTKSINEVEFSRHY